MLYQICYIKYNIYNIYKIDFVMYKYLWLLYLLRNKNYWKIIIEKKKEKKNIRVIRDHENISKVLYILYQKYVEIEIHIFIWIFYIKYL